MIEINILRTERKRVEIGLKKRQWNDEQINLLDEVISLDDDRKSIQTQLDQLLHQSNQKSKQIADLMKSGEKTSADALKLEVAENKESIRNLEDGLRQKRERIEELLLTIPNIPHESVDFGKDSEDNFIYKDWKKKLPELESWAIPHWELAEKHQLFDLKLGVKITGAGFPVYRNKGARLQRALINFFLDRAMLAGYEEIVPPLLVNEDSARGTGQLPDKEGQMYYAEKDDLYLIPTAEVPLTNIYRDEILEDDQLPIKLTGYTPCFRREAGSYGAHVKGLNRVHQFDKIEIVRIEHPDQSYKALHQMLDHVSSLLETLELPYRILRLCGGDMGFTSALTYDFEVYSAAQKRWLEVSSVSNFETYQSNRLKLRIRDKSGKNKLAHTLNGSALALARIVAALMENNQTQDGIIIPESLIPYTGFDKI
jgi:seryl-tRNA synthetase